jgi:hypothetical protein
MQPHAGQSAARPLNRLLSVQLLHRNLMPAQMAELLVDLSKATKIVDNWFKSAGTSWVQVILEGEVLMRLLHIAANL